MHRDTDDFCFCITLRRRSRRTAKSQFQKAFLRTSNWNSKKAVRFSLEVGRWRKTPRHQLFRNFSQKQTKYPVNSSMAGDFRFSYLLIKYRKVSGSDDTRNQFVLTHTRVRIPLSANKPLKTQCFQGFFLFDKKIPTLIFCVSAAFPSRFYALFRPWILE